MGIVERKEREREARRSQILDAARKVFEERGIGQATMDEIAREAELAKGTIYLYYKNKEELLLGLILKGFEVLIGLVSNSKESFPTGLEQLLGVSDAYRKFATEERFYFSLMNVTEPPAKSNISTELLAELGERTEQLWTLFVGMAEQAKLEGDITPEIDSFTFVVTLWLSATGVLRMYNKCLGSQNSVFSVQKHGVRLDRLDWNYVYELDARMLLENVLTDAGRKRLGPVAWRPSGFLEQTENCMSDQANDQANDHTANQLLEQSTEAILS